MAKRSILVSDFSGKEVNEENGATLRVTYGDSETVHVADLTADEAKTLLTITDKDGKKQFVAREQAKRGRKSGGDSEGETTED